MSSFDVEGEVGSWVLIIGGGVRGGGRFKGLGGGGRESTGMLWGSVNTLEDETGGSAKGVNESWEFANGSAAEWASE